MLHSILTGVAASLVASLLFLWALCKIKPKIEISPYIADQTIDGRHRYAFKIVNKTRSRVFDIKVQVLLIQPVQVHGGPVNNVHEIKLLKDHFFEMGPYDSQDVDAHYALRFGTDYDLRTRWHSDTQYLRVNVVCRHELSGFSTVKSVVFNTKGIIRVGKHEFGTGLEVKSG
jgi:hypothetical protein